MNDDLISREALRKAFHERIYYFNKLSWDEANAIIDNAPTVCNDNYSMGYQDGVKKVLSEKPQGNWIYGNLGYSTCSNCTYHNHYGDLPFCPNCGADMRGKNNED